MGSTSVLPDEKLLTVPEVAERLGVPVSWVYRHADQLGALQLGKYRRFQWQTVLEAARKGVTNGRFVKPTTRLGH